MVSRRLIPQQLRRSLILRRQRQFETKYGVDVQGSREANPHGNLLYGDNNPYEPIPFTQLKRLFKALPIDAREYSFIDLGCGKGAALVLAVEQGFRSAVGVEFDEDLAACAARNLQHVCAGRLPSCTVDIVTTDAAQYQFPYIPSIVFIYNSFGEDTMRAVLRNIEKSLTRHPRELYIAYFNPIERTVFESSAQLVSMRNRHVPSRFIIFKTALQFREASV